MKTLKNLKKYFQGRLLTNEPLSKHSTFKIGGPAKFYFEPESVEALKKAIKFAKAESIPFILIGRGSNILFKDKPYKGIVISLNSKQFKKINIENGLVKSGGGAGIKELIDFAVKKNLGGLEFMAGIPGTVGGSVAMNAGGKDTWIGNFVHKVIVLDRNCNIIEIPKNKIKFGYRSSGLLKYVILEVYFSLKKTTSKKSRTLFRNYLKEKNLKQELSIPNAGCVFKNPPGNSSGRLIELAGLKGRRIGDALISFKHANFIVNTGKAKAADILKLIKVIREKIKKDFGVSLDLEIKIL